jgi:hypothetical protein
MAHRVKEDSSYGLTHKTGTIAFDAGVRGPELERELRLAGEKFVKDMENRGLTLYQPQGGYLQGQDGQRMTNPAWVKYEGTEDQAAAFYAIDWEGKRKKEQVMVSGNDPAVSGEMIDLPTTRETSLEETEGEVEYRIVGIFWARKGATEVVTDRQQRLAAERAARHPVVFGPTGKAVR